MIKLAQITHTNYKGKVTYVLPGGVHTDSAFKAINYIEDLNQNNTDEPEQEVTSVSSTTCHSFVRNNTSDSRYFLGY